MKRRIFSFLIAIIFVLPFALMFAGCKSAEPVYPARIENVEADSVTNYWIEYSQSSTHHQLQTMAKATKDGVTYYYLIYYNNGNRNEKFVKLDANGHYKVFNWDYHNSTWAAINDENHPECGEGYDWFMFKTQFYSDYFSMALVNLQYTGEVNSLIRHENGTEITDMGTATYTTTGYTYGAIPVAAEQIENCRHFYDEQNDRHYYFAPETHFLLHLDGSSFEYTCQTAVYKRSFDMNYVLSVHDVTTAGLGFTVPEV